MLFQVHRLVGGAAVLAAAALLGCQAEIAPQVVTEGTTILIPIGDGSYNFGYGGFDDTPGASYYVDYERGRIQYELSSGDVLTTRVTLMANLPPAAKSMLQGTAYQPGMLISVVDVPLGTTPGVWSVSTKHYRHNIFGSEVYAGAGPPYHGMLTIVEQDVEDENDKVEMFTAAENIFSGSGLAVTVAEIASMVPSPIAAFVVRDDQNAPTDDVYAISATFTYPSADVDVLTVTDTQGPGSVELVDDDAQGTISFHVLNPNRPLKTLGIVFELDPSQQAPVGTNGFAASNVQLWSQTGAPLSGYQLIKAPLIQ